MGDVEKVLKFQWRGKCVDVKVDIDKTTLLDIVIEYEDEAKKKGVKLDFHFPTFEYAFDMKHHPLDSDKDLMKMFEQLAAKDVIQIWVGTVMKPSQIYKLVLNVRRSQEKKKKSGHEDILEDLPSLEDLEDTSMNVRQQVKKGVVITKGTQTTSKTPNKMTTKTTKQKHPPKKKATHPTNLPPPPISPKTTFQSLPMRRSPRFSPITSITLLDPINPIFSEPPTETMFAKKVPKSTARRKGLSLATPTLTEASMTAESSATGKMSAKRKMTFIEEESDENQGAEGNEGGILFNDNEEINTIPKVKDNWKHGQWHDFVDNEDDDEYYQRLYKNGEICEEKEFGKIELRPWMIFLDKSHFKDKLKDYCVQEGFAINVLWADNTRYTATCYAACCGWRIHSSMLPDSQGSKNSQGSS